MKLSNPAAAALVAVLLLACRPAAAVGFQWGMAPDPDGKPLELAIWYPSDAATDLTPRRSVLSSRPSRPTPPSPGNICRW